MKYGFVCSRKLIENGYEFVTYMEGTKLLKSQNDRPFMVEEAKDYLKKHDAKFSLVLILRRRLQEA